MKKIFITCMALAMTFLMQQEANACTGITLTAKDSARIVARTIEWGRERTEQPICRCPPRICAALIRTRLYAGRHENGGPLWLCGAFCRAEGICG